VLDRVEDEVNQVIGGHPLAQITGQEHRRLAVEVDESCGQDDPIHSAYNLFKTFSKI